MMVEPNPPDSERKITHRISTMNRSQTEEESVFRRSETGATKFDPEEFKRRLQDSLLVLAKVDPSTYEENALLGRSSFNDSNQLVDDYSNKKPIPAINVNRPGRRQKRSQMGSDASPEKSS